MSWLICMKTVNQCQSAERYLSLLGRKKTLSSFENSDMSNLTNSTKEDKELRSGYDLPVYGLDNGTFYYLHIPALFCIFASLSCVITVMVLIFRRKTARTFFSWPKSDRFIVYLAFCDGLFNVSHSMDHMNYVILRDHVRPKQLCEFYAFMLGEFVSAQNLMVNIVAINAFVLMYYGRNIDFGKRDWKLLTWTFGFPLLSMLPAALAGLLGPTGSYCYLDGVKGKTANMFYTSIPQIIVLLLNTVLYMLTWQRIRKETSSLNKSLQKTSTVNKSQRAAKNMSLFVLAFFIQWGPVCIYGIWTLFETTVPQPAVHLVTIFANIGGCLNLGVYFLIKRRNRDQRAGGSDGKSDEHVAETDLNVMNNKDCTEGSNDTS